MFAQRLVKTFVNFVPENRDLDLKDRSSIESFPDSCAKVAIS